MHKSVFDTIHIQLFSNRSPLLAVRRMAEYRSALPAAKAQAEFMALLAGNQVVLVAGETGCGKTTQIPRPARSARLQHPFFK